MPFNFDGLKMNAIQTDPNGIICPETIFTFAQQGNTVYANYSGGQIKQGFLIGIITGSNLQFRFCQIQTTGELDGGVSNCEIKVVNNLIQIIETFTWESRPTSGQNVIQQIK
jgi:hypothetical protein